MSIHHLLYVSRASAAPSKADLFALTARAALKNDRVGITGLLLYSSGHFMQLLEGHVNWLTEVFARIELDPRHGDVQRFVFQPVEKRLFPKWHMGLLNLDEPADLRRDELLNAFGNTLPTTGPARGAAAAVALLNDFRRQLPVG